MLDLLRKFNEDIPQFLFPEIELYKWDFKYNLDDNWERFMKITQTKLLIIIIINRITR
jgi:hypothetical protein